MNMLINIHKFVYKLERTAIILNEVLENKNIFMYPAEIVKWSVATGKGFELVYVWTLL